MQETVSIFVGVVLLLSALMYYAYKAGYKYGRKAGYKRGRKDGFDCGLMHLDQTIADVHKQYENVVPVEKHNVIVKTAEFNGFVRGLKKYDTVIKEGFDLGKITGGK